MIWKISSSQNGSVKELCLIIGNWRPASFGKFLINLKPSMQDLLLAGLFSSQCFPAWANCFPTEQFLSPTDSLMSSFWNSLGGQEVLPPPQNIKMFSGSIHKTNAISSPGNGIRLSVISLFRYLRLIKMICMVPVTVKLICQIKSEWALLFVSYFLQREHNV